MSRQAGGVLHLLWALYVVLLPVQFATAWGLRFAPSDLVALVLTAMLLATGQFRVPRRMLPVWVVLLVGVFALGTLRAALADGAPTRYVLAQKDLGLLLLLLQYVLVGVMVRRAVELRQALRWFVASVALLNLAALAEFVASRAGVLDLAWMNYGTERLSGLLVDPNAYGGLLATALAMVLPAAGSERRVLPGPLDGWVLLTLSAGVILTFSRTAWIAVGLMAVFAAVRRPAAAVRLSLAVTGAMLVLVASAGPSFLGLLQAMGGRRSQIISRIETSQQAWQAFLEHPVLGAGLGTFQQHHEYIVHNTGLWLLAELGLVGFVVFLGLMAWMWRRALLAVRTCAAADRGLAIGLTTALAAMLVLSLGIEALYQRHWWLLMGLVAVTPDTEGWRA